MKIAIMKGFVCGHTSERYEICLEDAKLEIHFEGQGYCTKCNDYLKIKRINIFVLERDVEVT